MDIEVKGRTVDAQTRCVHYASERDVIAIKFKCCGTYYPCHLCHHELANHSATQWGSHEHDTKAILCGVCKTELTIAEYLQSGHRCPSCGAHFNPGCANHHSLYFQSKP